MACPSVEGTSNYIWHTMLPLNHIKIINTGQDFKNQNILAYKGNKENKGNNTRTANPCSIMGPCRRKSSLPRLVCCSFLLGDRVIESTDLDDGCPVEEISCATGPTSSNRNVDGCRARA